MTVEIQAPAKINLSLRVLGKRPDGYHDIESFMTPLANVHDTLAISKDAPTLRFTCSQPQLETEDNLVISAVRTLEEETGRPLPVAIHLEKRTPCSAGLGGGSSDAAAALKALRDLYGLELDAARLEILAAELGSDVPFFIRGTTSWSRGRGEVLEPVNFAWKLNVLLVRHPLEIPTPWAYERWADSREIARLPYAPQPMPWGEVVNDLERPVFAKYLIIGDTKRWLLEQPEVQAACLTGSGSTLFALLRDDASETRAALSHRLRRRYGDNLWIA